MCIVAFASWRRDRTTLRHADFPDAGGTCVVCPLIVSGERRSQVGQPEPDSKCGLRGETNDTLGWLSTQNAERITPQRACRAVCSKHVVCGDRVLYILVVERGLCVQRWSQLSCRVYPTRGAGAECRAESGDETDYPRLI